jgi:tetratricopeptide (TPR) repeat protein
MVEFVHFPIPSFQLYIHFFLIQALILRQQGRIEESLTTFQAALCLNPMNVNNLKQVGRSLYLLGKHKTALDVFDEAEQLSSEDREIWHNKGMCYLYLKQYDKSIECFETANSIQRHESTFTQMGRVYRLLGKEEEALQVYMDALEACPENSELLTAVGLLYLKLGNNAKAFEYLGNSLTYDPKNAKTILAAGSIIQVCRYSLWLVTCLPDICQPCLFSRSTNKIKLTLYCYSTVIYYAQYKFLTYAAAFQYCYFRPSLKAALLIAIPLSTA